jgi:hypothetical protein
VLGVLLEGYLQVSYMKAPVWLFMLAMVPIFMVFSAEVSFSRTLKPVYPLSSVIPLSPVSG